MTPKFPVIFRIKRRLEKADAYSWILDSEEGGFFGVFHADNFDIFISENEIKFDDFVVKIEDIKHVIIKEEYNKNTETLLLYVDKTCYNINVKSVTGKYKDIFVLAKFFINILADRGQYKSFF